jgi:lipopolysaccharide transport system ATP-binding protein
MASVSCRNVTIEIPVFDARSFRSELLSHASGGKIVNVQNNTIIRPLTDVSFDITDGDKVGILGANGSGKSSLLRLIAGVYQPTLGSITVDGQVIPLIELGVGLEPDLTGYDNIKRILYIFNKETEIADGAHQEIADFSGLAEYLKLPIRTYSSGMLMRLMFSTMITFRPEIFVLDEFFSTGDEEFSKKVEKKMEEIIGQVKIFFFASHNKEVLKNYCDRFFKLDHGRLLEVGRDDF